MRIEALLDSAILIDLLRKQPKALAWAETQRDLKLGIHTLVEMELVAGVRNKEELAQLDRLLEAYEVVPLLPSDCMWANEQHRRFRFSHGVGAFDVLIASSAVRLKLPIYTLNVKHFDPLPDVKVIRPY